eukprot:363702-Chlamydomonas_euryale.AAC.6
MVRCCSPGCNLPAAPRCSGSGRPRRPDDLLNRVEVVLPAVLPLRNTRQQIAHHFKLLRQRRHAVGHTRLGSAHIVRRHRPRPLRAAHTTIAPRRCLACARRKRVGTRACPSGARWRPGGAAAAPGAATSAAAGRHAAARLEAARREAARREAARSDAACPEAAPAAAAALGAPMGLWPATLHGRPALVAASRQPDAAAAGPTAGRWGLGKMCVWAVPAARGWRAGWHLGRHVRGAPRATTAASGSPDTATGRCSAPSWSLRRGRSRTTVQRASVGAASDGAAVPKVHVAWQAPAACATADAP